MHRLNMELDLQSLFWLHVHSCTHWLRDRASPPPPPHLGSKARALLVSQDRRHLFVTPLGTGHGFNFSWFLRHKKALRLEVQVPVWRIRDPGSGKNLFRIPDPGVKKAPDPGSATLPSSMLNDQDCQRYYTRKLALCRVPGVFLAGPPYRDRR